MAEVTFYGAAEFPSRARLVLAALQTNGPPGFFRMVITDTELRIDGRWRPLRWLLPHRRCALSEIATVTNRGGLVIVTIADDRWWTMWSLKADRIVTELAARDVPIVGP